MLIGVLNQDAVRQLAEERIAWLCTVRRDGSPHQTPVWFCYLDDVFWIATAERNVKVANVERDPRVSLALPNGTRPLVAEGVVEVRRGSPPAAVAMAFAGKYGGWDIGDESPDGPRVLFHIAVSRWLMSGRAL